MLRLTERQNSTCTGSILRLSKLNRIYFCTGGMLGEKATICKHISHLSATAQYEQSLWHYYTTRRPKRGTQPWQTPHDVHPNKRCETERQNWLEYSGKKIKIKVTIAWVNASV